MARVWVIDLETCAPLLMWAIDAKEAVALGDYDYAPVRGDAPPMSSAPPEPMPPAQPRVRARRVS
jgi:hypothetical protein